jgi:hypothetical protein
MTGGFGMTTGESTMASGRVELLAPNGLVRSPAFSHVAVVSGAIRTIYVGGQDAVTADGEIVGRATWQPRPRRS